jgi:hypothetical protein
VFVLYTNDSILAGPKIGDIEQALERMQEAGLNLTVEGGISDFLAVKLSRWKDQKAFELTQPHLIQDVIKELRLEGDNVKTKVTPGASSKTLLRYNDEPDFDGHFDYRKVIGKLNYLEKCTRLDIACAPASSQVCGYTQETTCRSSQMDW